MEDFTLSFPFAKVDTARRVVTGIATADNLDPSGDTVEYAASKEAFANWEGNMREMHQPKAVGKAVGYQDVKVPFNGDIYNGIEVEAYVSKGAEDTWQKVLDGTLKGFSIGGEIIEKEFGKDPKTGRKVRKIKKYGLGELSFVDNPGNPAALITLVKRADDGVLEYALSKYDVYYCDKDNSAQMDDSVCPKCDTEMTFVGTANENKTDIVRKFVKSLGILNEDSVDYKEDIVEKLHDNEKTDIVKTMDTDFTDEQKDSMIERLRKSLFPDKSESVLLEATPVAPVVVNVYNSDIEKAAPPKAKADAAKADAEDAKDGGADDDEENADGSKKAVKKSADEGDNMDSEAILEAFGKMLDSKLDGVKEEISKSVDEKIEAITKSVDEVKELADATSEKVEKVESSGAVKKSVDADEEEDEKIEKKATESFWKGTFVPAEIVEVLGYSS